jgi:hypothetical protein
VAQALGGAVAQAPGATVALDQRRKRSLPARLEHAREQRLVAVAQVLDIVHVEFMGCFGIKDCSGHGAIRSRASCTDHRPSHRRRQP